MKTTSIVFNLISILVMFVTATASAKPTKEIAKELGAITAQYKEEAQKKKPDFNKLQLKASKKILALGKKALSAEQIDLFVDLLRVDIPVDEGQALVANTYSVIKANQPEIEKAVRKLPPAESEKILNAIDVAAFSANHPPD